MKLSAATSHATTLLHASATKRTGEKVEGNHKNIFRRNENAFGEVMLESFEEGNDNHVEMITETGGMELQLRSFSHYV